MEQKYMILRSVWFTPQSPVMIVGVIAIERQHNAKEWKAYIGLAGGHDREMDEQFVAGYGAKLVDKAQAAAFFPDLPIEDFVV